MIIEESLYLVPQIPTIQNYYFSELFSVMEQTSILLHIIKIILARFEIDFCSDFSILHNWRICETFDFEVVWSASKKSRVTKYLHKT